MMKTNYQKPHMKFVAFQNEETIANTCWGHHSQGTTLYADAKDRRHGYYSFQIAPGSCSLNLINVMYIVKDEKKPASCSQIGALTKILAASGGECGNPYKGEGTVVTTNPPCIMGS